MDHLCYSYNCSKRCCVAILMHRHVCMQGLNESCPVLKTCGKIAKKMYREKLVILGSIEDPLPCYGGMAGWFGMAGLIRG